MRPWVSCILAPEGTPSTNRTIKSTIAAVCSGSHKRKANTQMADDITVGSADTGVDALVVTTTAPPGWILRKKTPFLVIEDGRTGAVSASAAEEQGKECAQPKGVIHKRQKHATMQDHLVSDERGSRSPDATASPVTQRISGASHISNSSSSAETGNDHISIGSSTDNAMESLTDSELVPANEREGPDVVMMQEGNPAAEAGNIEGSTEALKKASGVSAHTVPTQALGVAAITDSGPSITPLDANQTTPRPTQIQPTAHRIPASSSPLLLTPSAERWLAWGAQELVAKSNINTLPEGFSQAEDDADARSGVTGVPHLSEMLEGISLKSSSLESMKRIRLAYPKTFSQVMKLSRLDRQSIMEDLAHMLHCLGKLTPVNTCEFDVVSLSDSLVRLESYRNGVLELSWLSTRIGQIRNSFSMKSMHQEFRTELEKLRRDRETLRKGFKAYRIKEAQVLSLRENLEKIEQDSWPLNLEDSLDRGLFP